MTPGELSSAVIAAVQDAVDDGDMAVPVPKRIPIKATASGDYATPLPLRLARAANLSAADVADLLAKRLSRKPGIQSARVTGPGFLTIRAPFTARIDESYGVTQVPHATWPVRPLTFDNPGFRVRFAYARAAGVLRHAADLGIENTTQPEPDDPRERVLLGLLAEFPGRAEQAARQDDPRPLTRQLELIADAYHDVHEQCPALPKGGEPPSGRHTARLGLAWAVRIVVGNGLRMLGETPSERL